MSHGYRGFFIFENEFIVSMTTQQLVAEIQRKKSFLCIGLDVDLDKTLHIY